jgi:hypothetical protein
VPLKEFFAADGAGVERLLLMKSRSLRAVKT